MKFWSLRCLAANDVDGCAPVGSIRGSDRSNLEGVYGCPCESADPERRFNVHDVDRRPRAGNSVLKRGVLHLVAARVGYGVDQKHDFAGVDAAIDLAKSRGCDQLCGLSRWLRIVVFMTRVGR